jgi:hypothetical protein
MDPKDSTGSRPKNLPNPVIELLLSLEENIERPSGDIRFHQRHLLDNQSGSGALLQLMPFPPVITSAAVDANMRPARLARSGNAPTRPGRRIEAPPAQWFDRATFSIAYARIIGFIFVACFEAMGDRLSSAGSLLRRSTRRVQRDHGTAGTRSCKVAALRR